MFKKSFVVMAVFAAVAGTVSVRSTEARSIDPRPIAAELTTWQLDPSVGSDDHVLSASIKIDRMKGEATLFIARGMNCPPNRMCPMMMPAPVIVTLPVVATRQDSCGTWIWTAKQDLRPVDGALAQLVIKDNTRNHCPHFVALASTEVRYSTAFYDRINGREVKSQSYLYGARLAPVELGDDRF
jgi:hypothetical protein